MKVFVLLFAVLATSVYAKSVENVDIDWSTVKPIEMYPKFWDNKPAELRPSASFFEQKYRVGRIVNGYIATPHQFPYQVALLMFLPSIGGNALCGKIINYLLKILQFANKHFSFSLLQEVHC